MTNAERKVITGRMVLKVITVLVVAAAIVVIISDLIRGVPFLEIFTDPVNLPIWIGTFASVSLYFFLYFEDKQKKGDNQESKEEKKDKDV